MSAGRESEGPGSVSWWGFSPARDLLPVRYEGEANVLLIGSGDPRHILKTIAGLQDTQSLHVWVIETSMEVVARQLLLLYLALIPKTEVFLEVFGNSEIRSQTEDTVRRAASQLSSSVTETLEAASHACLNTTLLKFKERDELATIFKLWIQPRPSSSSSEPPAPILMPKVWDYRVRQHLGTRYDSKKGCFDWDLTMKLHQKGQCGVINKQQYARWREQGLAFEMREGVYQIANPSLLSSRVFSRKGEKVAFRATGETLFPVLTSPFGIETDDKSLLKTQNGQHIKTAQDIAIANVQGLFQCLSSRRGCPTLMRLNGISVTFPAFGLTSQAARKTEILPLLQHHLCLCPDCSTRRCARRGVGLHSGSEQRARRKALRRKWRALWRLDLNRGVKGTVMNVHCVLHTTEEV
uniref:Dynein axonemal assembly factor 3 n=1 Tax=Amphiprion percula TaxID=161767 RepID=A0A3P8SLY9_AMPPE